MIANNTLMQRLLVDVGLKLESVDNGIRHLMRELPTDHPRRKELEKIRAEVVALHSMIVDCMTQASASVL